MTQRLIGLGKIVEFSLPPKDQNDNLDKNYKKMGFIHLRDSRMKLRTRVEDVDLAESVEILKKKAAELTGITATEQSRFPLSSSPPPSLFYQVRGKFDGSFSE